MSPRRNRGQGRSPRRALGLVGAGLISVFVAAALFPQWLAPNDPYAFLGRPFEPPSATFWLGTNDIGQDIFSELVWGSRVSITVGLTAGLISSMLGLLTGLVAGYGPPRLEAAIMRLIDIVLVLPFLPLMILLSSFIGPSLSTLILVISATSWAGPARVIRAQTLSLKREGYVEAAVALGATHLRIMVRHIMPSLLTLTLAQFVGNASAAILTEAALSFLGLGDPLVKSWGTILQFAQTRGAFFTGAWLWWVIPPGLCITASTVGLALVGFFLEEALDPRLQRR